MYSTKLVTERLCSLSCFQ